MTILSVFDVSFLPLDRKEPKDQGRHQGPAALGNRSSPMSAGPARPARSVFGKPGLRDCLETLLPLYYARPKSLIAEGPSIRESGTRSLTLLGTTRFMRSRVCARDEAAGLGFRSFLLIGRNRRIKADIKGLPHLATAPPPCRPGLPALPGLVLAFPV